MAMPSINTDAKIRQLTMGQRLGLTPEELECFCNQTGLPEPTLLTKNFLLNYFGAIVYNGNNSKYKDVSNLLELVSDARLICLYEDTDESDPDDVNSGEVFTIGFHESLIQSNCVGSAVKLNEIMQFDLFPVGHHIGMGYDCDMLMDCEGCLWLYEGIGDSVFRVGYDIDESINNMLEDKLRIARSDLCVYGKDLFEIDRNSDGWVIVSEEEYKRRVLLRSE